MSFDPLTSPVDHFLLAGERSPGIAEVASAPSPRELTERRGYGTSGASVVFRGIKLVPIKITIKLYTVEDWAAWREFLPLLARPPLGRRAQAMDIWHPILEDQGVRSVLVKEVGSPTQTGDGEWSISIDMIEWRRPQPALSAPAGSASSDPPSAIDLATARNASLSAEGDRLAAQLDALGGGP